MATKTIRYEGYGVKDMDKVRKEVFEKVSDERERQLEKLGEQHHSAGDWMLILTEEIGETAQAILQERPADVETELVQVAAVAVAWLEAIRGPHYDCTDCGTKDYMNHAADCKYGSE